MASTLAPPREAKAQGLHRRAAEPKGTARTSTRPCEDLPNPRGRLESLLMHIRGCCYTNSPSNRAFRGLTRPKPQACRALNALVCRHGDSGRATAGTAGSGSRERLSPFLLRRAGARGQRELVPRLCWPGSRASMVSSSREDMRYLGTACHPGRRMARSGGGVASDL